MDSIFTKIISRQINSYIISEDDDNIAFLDINPVMEGHTLCVPKIQINNIYDLEQNLYNSFFNFTKKIAKSLKITYPKFKISTAIVGLEIDHAHLHLIPIKKMEDYNFTKEKKFFSVDQFNKIKQKIIKNL